MCLANQCQSQTAVSIPANPCVVKQELVLQAGKEGIWWILQQTGGLDNRAAASAWRHNQINSQTWSCSRGHYHALPKSPFWVRMLEAAMLHRHTVHWQSSLHCMSIHYIKKNIWYYGCNMVWSYKSIIISKLQIIINDWHLLLLWLYIVHWDWNELDR